MYISNESDSACLTAQGKIHEVLEENSLRYKDAYIYPDGSMYMVIEIDGGIEKLEETPSKLKPDICICDWIEIDEHHDTLGEYVKHLKMIH